MIRRTAGYLAVFLFTAYLFFMYDAEALSGMLALCCLYPFFSAAWLLFAGKKAVPDLYRVPSVGEAGKQVKAGISVKNMSAHNCLRYEAVLSVGGRRGKKRAKRRLGGALEPGGTETVWCVFEARYCGITEICLESIKVYDFLGIFYRKVKWNKKAQVKIMPEFRLMPLEITRKTREFQAEAQEFSGQRRGDDPSEIYQVREYKEKDSLKDIHWKLSAREEKLMVKERSFPLGCVVLIYIDYRKENESESGFSHMLETVASLSVTLAEEKCIHMAAWYEEKNERIIRWRISDAESACEMIWGLMEAEPCRDAEKSAACYEDAFRGVEFSSIITVDGNGDMKKDGESFDFLRV